MVGNCPYKGKQKEKSKILVICNYIWHMRKSELYELMWKIILLNTEPLPKLFCQKCMMLARFSISSSSEWLWKCKERQDRNHQWSTQLAYSPDRRFHLILKFLDGRTDEWTQGRMDNLCENSYSNSNPYRPGLWSASWINFQLWK